MIQSLEDEIAWWRARAFASMNEAAFCAFGVATGLKIARADYGACDQMNERLLISDAANPLLMRACQMIEVACKNERVDHSKVMIELPARVFDKLVGTHTKQTFMRGIKVRRGI
ncbi:MAG TPA: hypothetical protein VF760_00590 [Xanthobacteraceae bacterium]